MLKLDDYRQIWEKERLLEYPEVDAIEKSLGFAVDRERLERAAFTLACPVKVNPPVWQHGRVVYAAAGYAAVRTSGGVFLDVGTAKGFSACAIGWALEACDSRGAEVVSVDVVDPLARCQRNSAAELSGLLTVPEFVEPHIAKGVKTTFLGMGSVVWLKGAIRDHVHVPFAFLDGKHSYEVVHVEIESLRQVQELGDVIVFDDLQIPAVARAVSEIKGYGVVKVTAGFRTYAVAIRAGL